MPSLSRVISPPVNTCEGSGYITAPILVSSQQHYGIEVIGLGRPDVKWQANTKDGIDISQFRIDWNQQQATWPESGRPVTVGRLLSTIARMRSSRSSSPPQIAAAVLCRLAVSAETKKYKRRTITLRPQAQHEALQAARRRQQTRAFTKLYALREGIEASISESAFVPLACAAPVISAWPKRISNTLELLLR